MNDNVVTDTDVFVEADVADVADTDVCVEADAGDIDVCVETDITDTKVSFFCSFGVVVVNEKVLDGVMVGDKYFVVVDIGCKLLVIYLGSLMFWYLETF